LRDVRWPAFLTDDARTQNSMSGEASEGLEALRTAGLHPSDEDLSLGPGSGDRRYGLLWICEK